MKFYNNIIKQFKEDNNKMNEQVSNDLPSFEDAFKDKDLFNDETATVVYEEIGALDSNNNERYMLDTSDEGLGYYLNKGGIQISNFYIQLQKWVKTFRDGEPLSYYEGDIYFSDGTFMHIDRMTASTLEDPSGFRKYIGNLCGTKALIKGTPNDVVKAIKTFNKNVEKFQEHEFGYNDNLDSYYTGDLVIRADEIIPVKTPIKYSDHWGNNKLCFKYYSKEEADAVKQFIIEKLLLWEDPKVLFNIIAFTFFPVIYPFLKHKNPNKFYLMLKGPSGSGKSQMSKWSQSFYGNFLTLLPWTSTDTSINIVGSAFKDAIFAVDDLKVQNFRSDNDAKKVMMVLQNYSDGTGRQRANVDLKLKDERVIKGHLLISAEDLVVSETSTIARGIIINVNSKQVRSNELWEINDESKKFSAIMPYFIKFLLKHYDKNKIGQVFEDAHKFISSHPLINDPNISSDNLPRIINNFATLKTSWEILSEFMFDVQSEFDILEFQEAFDKNLITLLLDNIERISSYKPDVIFEKTLWEMIENGMFSLRKVLNNGELETPRYDDRGKVIGYYTQDNHNEINLVIQLSTALREMKKTIENFATSEDTLRAKLLREKKIKVNPSKKVSLNGRKISGVQWIGEYPKGIFGLNETVDPVEQAKEILAEGLSEEADVLF